MRETEEEILIFGQSILNSEKLQPNYLNNYHQLNSKKFAPVFVRVELIITPLSYV
ncbi:unnamed protein product [Sphenostylis stenocarpa]|uniref:Uncharacterized protein n=1 Tax=Sphenostylis stenocarpa TaxID=92480 RepID=A0AA86W2M2_9FABA|nr:unnamed protein product [Sphenostylis stenocarpa]